MLASTIRLSRFVFVLAASIAVDWHNRPIFSVIPKSRQATSAVLASSSDHERSEPSFLKRGCEQKTCRAASEARFQPS